jgi:hypothetical protein
VEFDIREINSSIFWDEEVPLILEQALEIMRISGEPVIFDAVIVDEAQDFSRDWWVTIESMTRDGGGSARGENRVARRSGPPPKPRS